MIPLLTVAIRQERDVVSVRRRARQIAALLGFDGQDQTRIATAVSEIARNAFVYARGGRADFAVEGQTPPQVLMARVSDEGPGIARLEDVLAGTYRSPTGMGLGIVGARRLMDRFEIQSAPGGGTSVTLRKLLPRRAERLTSARAADLVAALAARQSDDPLDEVQQQNAELMRALDELRRRQEELQHINRELEDTNRGVVALYAELDEKAEHLRRADEMKSRFLSNMSHEFRTPLHSILALSQLLSDGTDGPLAPEQHKQVGLLRKAAQDLLELVDDLLDIAKVEAGKVRVRPVEFEVENLFGALRGMLRPMLINQSVELVFEPADDLPPIVSDEGKVSQILRNFLSNALKFTERGEVRIAARLSEDKDELVIAVSDTGIGIAPEDQERIFQEFTQLDNPLQRHVKGTGLGLPLTRRLAALLGGRVGVDSAPGVGSTFWLALPVSYPYGEAAATVDLVDVDPDRLPVLVVEDSAEAQLVYRKFARGTRFEIIATRTLREARQALKRFTPRVIVLDIVLRGEDAWEFLAELKGGRETAQIPILVVSSVDEARKGLGLGADAYCVKPIDRQTLLEHLTRLSSGREVRRFLIIDDEEISRYLLRRFLSGGTCTIHEAASGEEGVRLAREIRPSAIFLDIVMPGLDGFGVLEQLKADPATRGIPVIVVTGHRLSAEERRRLAEHAVAILPKETSSRDLATSGLREALTRAGMTD